MTHVMRWTGAWSFAFAAVERRGPDAPFRVRVRSRFTIYSDPTPTIVWLYPGPAPRVSQATICCVTSGLLSSCMWFMR